MANPWFKFFGGEYLADQKIETLSAAERSCWITLLCYASQSNGVVRFLTEEQLMIRAGMNFQGDGWDRTKGVLDTFKKLKMVSVRNGIVTILNWKKRQEIYLSNAERQAKYRERNKIITRPVTKITLEENRRDKNRRDKNRREESKPSSSPSFLEKIPTQNLRELSEKYKISPRGIQSKATDLKLYCESKGKSYKNYRAFLENALRKDAPKLRNEYPLPTPVFRAPEEPKLTPEQEKKNEELRKDIHSLAFKKKI